ncbi:PEP-CTERM sorting domain-containing protein [Actimicrobium antarcticum]|uniref:Ice-binding protein C-terminal domain-containing protein n=1 Tax=Actimicrobium antarcticum TaxID=1051899 RepID=A0ABP7SMB8_9BURK
MFGWSGFLYFSFLLMMGSQANADNLRPGTESFASVEQNLSGTFDYRVFTFAGFPVSADLPVLNMVDFYLPYFSDMGLTRIEAPEDWVYGIEKNNDLFGVGGGVLHFSTSARDSVFQDYGQIFSFQSVFSGINSPYMQILAGVDSNAVAYNIGLGSQLIPGSPMALAAFASPVPEPSSMALLLGGLVVLGGVSWRRRQGTAGRF